MKSQITVEIKRISRFSLESFIIHVNGVQVSEFLSLPGAVTYCQKKYPKFQLKVA